ncbi:Variant surface glycoprotein, partial [Trypanosoma congolense IL3000]
MWMREPRMIGRGTCMIMVLAMVVNLVHAYPPGTVFNDGEYNALCGVFHASLDLWNATHTAGKVPSNGLKAALGQALFGKSSGGSLESLKDELPKEYRDPGQRKYRCGYCEHREETYAGKSITHDLMCLCTPGKDAEPFYGYYWWFGYYYKENGFKLCGRLREEMGVDLSHGWYESGRKRGTNGLKESWRTVIMGCFNSWKNSTKKGSDTMEEKLKTLTETMKHLETKFLKKVGGRHKLGEFNENNEADGSSEKHIHVRYGTCTRGRAPWWKKLQDELKKPQDQLLLEPTVAAQEAISTEGQQEGEEEEVLMKVEDFSPQEEDTLGGSTTKSPKQDINSTQTINQSNDNSTVSMLNTSETGNSTYPRLEYLRSNTPKTPPCSGIIRAYSSSKIPFRKTYKDPFHK